MPADILNIRLFIQIQTTRFFLPPSQSSFRCNSLTDLKFNKGFFILVENGVRQMFGINTDGSICMPIPITCGLLPWQNSVAMILVKLMHLPASVKFIHILQIISSLVCVRVLSCLHWIKIFVFGIHFVLHFRTYNCDKHFVGIMRIFITTVSFNIFKQCRVLSSALTAIFDF